MSTSAWRLLSARMHGPDLQSAMIAPVLGASCSPYTLNPQALYVPFTSRLMLASKDTRICHFYQQQRCAKGARCPFRHEQAAGAPTPRPAPCMFWQSGACTKGPMCNFSHDTPVTVQKDSPHSSRPQCKFYLQNACKAGANCPFAHSPRTVALSPQSPHRTQSTGSPTIEQPTACRYFLQGRCTASRCAFSHSRPATEPSLTVPNKETPQARSPPREIIGPSAVPAEDASGVNEIVEDSDWRKVPGTHIQVRFGDGAAVQEVMTAFDSMRVLLDNLPPDVTESDIRPLVDSFGQLADVTVFGLDPTGKHASAVVEFDSCLSALNAATALNEIVVSSASGAASPCIASVQARAGERGAATLRSNSVRLTWHAPSRLAYAHYATTKRAKWNAERLDGMSFDHRKITASFQKPKWNQESSFTVVLANLPLDAPCDHLQRFAHADSVTLGKVSYEEYPAIVSIRSALMQYGGLESLETHPSTARSTKVKALARFATPSAAEEATLALHGRPQSFLGNGPLWIERVYSIKYTASRPQYEALKHDLSMLQAVDPKENPARIRVYDVDAKGLPVDSVMVRVYCSEPKPLGKLKAVVERVLAGERWVNESGAGVWDDCFSTAVGEELLAAANATGNGFARRDVHRRSIHMYGSDEGRAFLRFHISEGLDTVRSRRQTVAVDKAMMRHLVTGGFARIQDEYGIDNVTLNVAARTLEVRSDDVDSALIQRLLHDPSTVPAFEPAIATAECPICFCQVTKPMTLLCGHVYCTACVQHYMTSAAHSDEFPVKCLGEEGSCGIAIPSKDLERLLKPDDEEAMMQSSFLSFVRAHPNEYRYCPTPDCPELYRPAAEGTVLQCPSCLGKVCPACHQEFHEGSSCAEYREAQAGLGGDESFRLWRLKNFVQPCPGCGMLLDKISGCNHVVCGVCKTHMCWKCMGVFAAGEIYEHMSRAHGREGMYA